jgi:hypothetical protein
MNAQELLIPRFEVIADFPNSNLEIKSILSFDGVVYGMNEPQKFIRNPEKYPHLFRRLNWWEHRKVEEMPKRLICKAIPNDTEVMDIQEWDMEMLVGWTNKEKRQCCSLRSFNPEYGYFPAE